MYYILLLSLDSVNESFSYPCSDFVLVSSFEEIIIIIQILNFLIAN